MSQEDLPELDAEIREIFALDDSGQHPSSEALAAYARGELTEVEAERLQEHLGPCRECTAMVLALELPHCEAPEHDRPPDAEVASGVEALLARVRSTEVVPQRNPPGRGGMILAVAAVLAVACLALAFFNLELRRDVGELEAAFKRASAAPVSPLSQDTARPQTGVPIVDLFPSSVARGEAAVPRQVRFPLDAMTVTLILTPPSGLSHEAFALGIFDDAETELWHGPAQPNEAGAFVLLLPRRFAEAGADRIVLYGQDGAVEKRLETYRVHFEL